MVAPMIPPPTAPAFLAAHGWSDAEILPLAGDASFRRYFRVVAPGRTAVLMDAPPEHEDLGPFLRVATELETFDLSAPRALAVDRGQGLLLLDDFGDRLVGPVLLREPELEQGIYADAIDILVRLADRSAPDDIAPYDDAVMLREVSLFPEWYTPGLGLDVDVAGFAAAWRAVWASVEAQARSRPVLTLRDYHAENLMLLDRPGLKRLGLLDFQDALAGHPMYDLVSLLQDARRDVAPELEAAMLDRWLAAADGWDGDAMRDAYQVLGAQRNTKILGIFSRLWKRDGKPHYLSLQPRVWGYLERNLAYPALAPVRAWFDANVPADKRGTAWSTLSA